MQQHNIHSKQTKTYIIMPVLNRQDTIAHTIKRLQDQTYANKEIIIIDRGSDDGTADILEKTPDITYLHGSKMWWAEAMALGISHVLEQNPHDEDFIIMMQDDTDFQDDFTSNMVKSATHFGAALGAVLIDSDDPSLITQAGVHIDWSRYRFIIRRELTVMTDQIATIREEYDTDVLPSRGSIYPIFMVKAVGNIDAQTFPNHLADYDFSLRLKGKGYPLLICPFVRLSSTCDETGLIRKLEKLTLPMIWTSLTDPSSTTRLRDHIRLIKRHAPRKRKLKAYLGLISFIARALQAVK